MGVEFHFCHRLHEIGISTSVLTRAFPIQLYPILGDLFTTRIASAFVRHFLHALTAVSALFLSSLSTFADPANVGKIFPPGWKLLRGLTNLTAKGVIPIETEEITCNPRDV